MPGEGEKLSHPPPNLFVPREDLIEKKLPTPETPAKPKLIKQEPSSEIWFKQDDSFPQPFIWAKVKVSTTDCDFPATNSSQWFVTMWESMLKESTRELTYMAQEAQIHFAINKPSEYITF